MAPTIPAIGVIVKLILQDYFHQIAIGFVSLILQRRSGVADRADDPYNRQGLRIFGFVRAFPAPEPEDSAGTDDRSMAGRCIDA